MDVTSGFLAAIGLLLVFVLPGYTITKALFPEWRVRGPTAGLTAVEIVSLTLVNSVALTIVIGFALLVLPGRGFAATWSDPLLEIVLAGISVLALGVGMVRGAYSQRPPPAPAPIDDPGTRDGWELVQRLEAIDRERRRLRHVLRRAGASPTEADRARSTIAQLDAEAAALRRDREAEYGR